MESPVDIFKTYEQQKIDEEVEKMKNTTIGKNQRFLQLKINDRYREIGGEGADTIHENKNIISKQPQEDQHKPPLIKNSIPIKNSNSSKKLKNGFKIYPSN